MEFPADEKYVRSLGRNRVQDGVRYLGYSCSCVEFLFKGSKAQAVLWTDSPELEEHLKAWVAVFVNDEEVPSRRFMLDQTEAEYLLYDSECEKITKLRLVKYSEAAFGKVGIKKLRIDGITPPEPTPAKSRRLEFIGDSITCGYGNEGEWNVDGFHTAQENPWDAYAATTARTLGADYHLISWSGIGIISNWTDQEIPNDDWLMPELYPYTDKALDLKLETEVLAFWDFQRYVPDCIIVNLGTNDFSYTRDVPDRVAVFEEKYGEFIRQVRQCNPGAVILCTLGVMGGELGPSVERQVRRLTDEGDTRVFYMPFDLQKTKDGIGADWHPGKLTHRKMAEKLTAKIRELMSW